MTMVTMMMTMLRCRPWCPRRRRRRRPPPGPGRRGSGRPGERTHLRWLDPVSWHDLRGGRTIPPDATANRRDPIDQCSIERAFESEVLPREGGIVPTETTGTRRPAPDRGRGRGARRNCIVGSKARWPSPDQERHPDCTETASENLAPTKGTTPCRCSPDRPHLWPRRQIMKHLRRHGVQTTLSRSTRH